VFSYKGYAGKGLVVDLTRGLVEPRDLDAAFAEAYLGGNGFGTRLLWENVGPGVEPFSPENLLIVATGPLCGTPLPTSGRMEFVAKSPLTGIYGDSNAGGYLGPEIKFAGWDYVVFSGCAAEPVYLNIQDDRVELRDARHLWGRTTSQTEQAIRKQWGDDKVKTATIGPAGENRVRFAGIQVTSQRSAARCGLGAVMGSKNLKAIAVRGRGEVPLADAGRLGQLAREFHRRLRENPIYPAVHAHGTPGIAALMNALGRFPTKNFQMGSFEGIDQIDADALETRAFVRHMGCYGCSVACDKLYRIPDGPYAGTTLHSVEYETLNAFGGGILNPNLDSILFANQLCDDLGLDTISTGRVIAFAMELWEKGILTPSDTGKMGLQWGDMEATLALIEMIAMRQGVGDLMAEGVRRMAAIVGRGAEQYAMHVKGMEIPAQDGRAQRSMGLAHVTSSRGADHLKAFPTIDETGYPDEARRRYGEEYLPELAQPLATKHKPMLVKDGEDFGAVIDSVGLCKSGGTFVLAEFYWADIAEALEAATGMEMPPEQLKQVGERIYNLQRCYNALHGISRADDVLPERFSKEPSPSGNARGQVIDVEPMLEEYYTLRGWDLSTGWPADEKLLDLGLDDARSVLAGLRRRRENADP
jgi:aldehyde:ferredoxin oxidoreductase